MRIGEWRDAREELPDGHTEVLILKQLKNGTRTIGIGFCIPDYERTDYQTGEKTVEPYWVCGGNNNVVRWMPLPEIPAE